MLKPLRLKKDTRLWLFNTQYKQNIKYSMNRLISKSGGFFMPKSRYIIQIGGEVD